MRKGEGLATMQASDVPRATAAARSTALSVGLAVDDAIVLHDSNKLTLRLLPCDVLARVAPVAQHSTPAATRVTIRITSNAKADQRFRRVATFVRMGEATAVRRLRRLLQTTSEGAP